jgi:pimeloyl-ACP methyl ester carboxylesterase
MDDKVLWVRGSAGEKRAYQRLAMRMLLRHQKASARTRNPATVHNGQHVFVLHGWSLNEQSVSSLSRALSELPGAENWTFWDITYDTEWTSFSDSAAQIAASLRENEIEFRQTILFGYSMGGLVARQMVADGWPCRDLVSICTPHHGPMKWWPPYGRGPRSMRAFSPQMRALNSHPLDRAARSRYHFFGLTYHDLLGEHEHDCVVPIWSALGCGLGPVARRETRQLRYKSVSLYDAHWRGKQPHYISPVLKTASELFQDQG